MINILYFTILITAAQHTSIKQKNSKLEQIRQANNTDDCKCISIFSLERQQFNSDIMGRTKAKRLKKLIQAKTFQMRRYAQFEDMFRNEFNNHTLLLRFYAYGCYCLNLGDRPMAGIMTGMEPADLLDE